MYTRKEERIIDLTPEYADKLLEYWNNYTGQRNLRRGRVEELVLKQGQNRFRTAQVSVAHCEGVEYLMNGQHQCKMVIETGETVRCFLEEFWCDRQVDLATLFSQFDDGNMRSAGQVAYAHARGAGLELTRRCTAICAASLAMLEYGEAYVHVTSREQRAELLILPSNWAEIEWVRKTLFDGERVIYMTKIPVVAAMMATHRKRPLAAESFWWSVRTGEMLQATAPAYILRNYLMGASQSSRKGKMQLHPEAIKRETYVKCIHAWNAYRQGGPTKLRYYPDSPIPPIAG